MFSRIITSSALSCLMLCGTLVLADDAQSKKDESAKKNATEKGKVCTSETIGSKVVNDDNDAIAAVDDVVLMPDGSIAYFILGHGGILGIGESHIAIPVDAMHVTVKTDEDGERAVRFHLAGMTSDKLDKAPLLKKAGYPELFDETWVRENAAYFQTDAPNINNRVMFGSELLSANVNDANDEKLAAIDYLIYDLKGMNVQYLLVDHESTLTDDMLVAVPYRAVDWRRDEDRHLTPILATTAEKLNAAPRVKLGDFDQFDDKEFIERVNRVYSERTVSAN